jgi:hypothetical protein
MAIGCIYILSNAAHHDLLKIGFTCKPVKDRAAELSSTAVPHPFEVEFFQLTGDGEEVETLIHAELQAARPNTNREFFRVALPAAVTAIEKHIRRPVDRFVRETLPLPAKKPCWRCGHIFARTPENRFYPKCGF